MTSQPSAADHDSARPCKAPEPTEPIARLTSCDALVLPRRRGIHQLGLERPARPRDRQLAPVTVTWPSQTSSTVISPTVEWVPIVITHETTKNAVETHA